ncbi:MAG: Lrp/AsnC family transcriptional regulator [Sphingopyxis sp.]|uniref:Lrp/AsnC family transcriptional regulator n=1 Tax=Sphingopyxis sp. TaxID=1908224 RepID=UPI002ABA721C|nr:Lrp/AsnC family transcriptional regulator [Sphingopyxis sp.]MDZ3831882.1 Lrp/AsnC family transcriptional regulator [Sphingopyxis sp.]
MEKIDQIDRLILRQLQRDCSLSLEKLAEKLGLSTNACWRRVKRLNDAGIIERRVALVVPESVGWGVTVFVAIKTNDHSEAWLTKFAAAASQIEEVVEFYRIAGDVDYLLKLLVRDVTDYDRVYKKLASAVSMSDVSASFAMERIKYETAVPI